ncbi:MAG: hypothetical protein ACRDPQ_14040 [Nocardioidaceae bacterium]
MPDGVETLMLEALIQAAIDGDELPDVGMSLVQNRAADEAERATTRIVSMALDTLAGRVRAYGSAHGDQLVTESLRPAFEKCVAEHAKSYGIMREHGELDHGRLLGAPQKVRVAALTEATTVETWTAIQTARDDLHRVGYKPEQDVEGEFLTVKVGAQRRHSNRLAHGSKTPPPWPTDGVLAFLRWVADNGAELWMPTRAEQDAAFDAAYGEAIRDQRQRVQQQQALASTVGQ